MRRVLPLWTLLSFTLLVAQPANNWHWEHLSTVQGNLPSPNTGKEQTSATVFDVDNDGVNDFVITERTAPDSVTWYRHSAHSWERFVIEAEPMQIEAGSTYMDVDGDGDLDFLAAGDWRSKDVWWWENPAPQFAAPTPWKRHLVIQGQFPKHHDSVVGDFLGDGKQQYVFWNQDAHTLFFATVPSNVRETTAWPLTPIYTYGASSQPEQRGKAAYFKGSNEHEGLAAGDIDGDGKLDLIAGGHWLRNLGNGKFEPNVIDAGYTFSRAAAGHLLKDSKEQQVVLVIGDGEGPLMWYQLVKTTWVPHVIADIHYGHNIQLVDFDGDGNLDIFTAEQRLDCANPDAKAYLFFGDGKGNFRQSILASGLDSHESRVADLDGNGTLDLLIKPYNCQTPRLDILLNMGRRP